MPLEVEETYECFYRKPVYIGDSCVKYDGMKLKNDNEVTKNRIMIALCYLGMKKLDNEIMISLLT